MISSTWPQTLAVPKFGTQRTDLPDIVNKPILKELNGQSPSQSPVQLNRSIEVDTNGKFRTERPSSTTADDVTADPNWQSSKTCIRERNAAMFRNELMSDIQFIVGSSESPDQTVSIPAHKYVLATSSSVFYAMFYGSLAEDKEQICIPDVEPNAFITMLRYMYCDIVDIKPESVLSLLYCAKKYLLSDLAKRCVQYLELNITVHNVCLLLKQSRLFDEDKLLQRCFEVIDAQTELVLTSDEFTEIDHNTLQCILSRDTLNTKEITIFNAVLKWASAECKRRKLKDNIENKRKVLGEMLFLVRIPTMKIEEFANSLAHDILTIKEINDIFLYYTAITKPTIKFSAKKRSGLSIQICQRFQSSAYRSNQWRYNGRCDSIQFSVNKRIFIVGFGLYGSSNGSNEYKVKIELKRLHQVLANKHTHFFSDGTNNTFSVFFDYPIPIQANTFYIASAVLEGNELSHFGQDGLSEITTNAGVTFQFKFSSESTNGTGVQGGQIPEILFYVPM